MPKKYRVTLTGEEREELERLLSRGKADVRCLKPAPGPLQGGKAARGAGGGAARGARGAARPRLGPPRILRTPARADGCPGWSDERIAEAFHAGVATVERLRQRFVEEGLQAGRGTARTGGRPLGAA